MSKRKTYRFVLQSSELTFDGEVVKFYSKPVKLTKAQFDAAMDILLHERSEVASILHPGETYTKGWEYA